MPSEILILWVWVWLVTFFSRLDIPVGLLLLKGAYDYKEKRGWR